jgi:hypothetical protein
MDRSDYITFLEEALDNQRLGQRLQISLAITVVLLGVVAVFVSQLFPEVSGIANQKLLGALGGATVSALSAFPIKQITERRSRIAALRFLLTGFQRLEQDDKTGSDEWPQLEARFWKLMDTSLGK